MRGWHVRTSLLALSVLVTSTAAYAQHGALFVSNYVDNNVSVYPRAVSGSVGPTAVITAGLNGPHEVAINSATKELIVANNAGASVGFYNADPASPAFGALTRTIAGANTQLFNPLGVAVDTLHNELFVSNDDRSAIAYSITVYDLTTLAAGGNNVAPIRTIRGAATMLQSPAGMAIVGDEILVVNYALFDVPSIAVFPRQANGNVAPVRAIRGANTRLDRPLGIVYDGAGRIYVANSAYDKSNTKGAVLAFNFNDTGNVAPTLSLEGDASLVCHPAQIALDLASREVLVANAGGCKEAVTVYDMNAFPGAGTFSQAPTRAVVTGATVQFDPIGVAVSGTSLFVSNYVQNTVNVYPRTVNGAMGAARVITDGLNRPHEVIVNLATKELIAANNLGHTITFYDADVASPNFGQLKRTLAGAATGLIYPVGVAVDTLHNELFVSNDDHSGAAYSITVYDLATLGAGGNVAPIRRIVGPATTLSSPAGIAVDSVWNDEIFVVNYDGFGRNGGPSIAVFPRTANGDVMPRRTIQGPNTSLRYPQGLLYDMLRRRLYVANSAFDSSAAGSVIVFNDIDSGNVAPTLSLSGDATKLCHPSQLAMDDLANELTVANAGGCVEAVTVYDLAQWPSAGAISQAPKRTLSTGARTQYNPIGVAVIPDQPKLMSNIGPLQASVPGGAPATFNPGVDTCTPASGSIFPLGVTTVRCVGSDIFGTTTSSFTVSVQDTLPPVFSGLANLEAEAFTSTEVVWDVTATDRGVNVPVACNPASGSLFYVGTTTVTCAATPIYGGPGASASFTVTVTRKMSPLPGGACFVVDFREITYFNGSAVITSTDADVRTRNGIAGAFNPALWPYRAAGGTGYTKSKGTLFRIYGFTASSFGALIQNEDMPWVTYPVQFDADANGFYVDLGGPVRVRVCPNQFQDYVLVGKKGNGHKDSSALLPSSQQNVPGIMLAHNTQVVKLPTRIKREMASIGLAYGFFGKIDFISVQQQGNGNSQFREFVNVQLSFPGDSQIDRLQHYAFGLLTAFNVNFESFAGCNYVDYAPGNDSVRLVDLWSPNRSAKQGYNVWQACGTKEPAVNQKQRENYDVAYNAIQVLSTVNTGTDTVNVFYGPIEPLTLKDLLRKDLKIDWFDWDKADR